MSYLVKKQYSLRSQPFYKLYGLQVAFVEPDSESRALYGQSLKNVNVEVDQFQNLAELFDQLNNKEFQIIIVSPSTRDIPQLAQLKAFVPEIPLITLSKMMSETQLDGIMKLGVTMHINRDLTRPRDLLVAIEQILTGLA